MRTGYKPREGEKILGASKIVIIKEAKTCLCCGKLWKRVPAFGIEFDQAYWWDCNCRSTLFIPFHKAA